MTKPLLDKKDLAIVTALNRRGGKASAEQLSEDLGIPARTVRYRISRMRRSRFLHPPYVVTHERKLGAGEAIATMKATCKGNRLLEKALNDSPAIYWFTESYGTFDGYIAHIYYPLTSAAFAENIMKAMQNEGLVSEFSILDIVDYEYKNGDYRLLNEDLKWQHDWDAWRNDIVKNLKSKKSFIPKLDFNPSLVDFDENDVLLIKHLMDNGEITQKKLGKILRLSEPLVNKKLARLNRTGIIKGYRVEFDCHKENIYLNLTFELEDDSNGILASFYQLPHPFYIIMESRSRYSIRIALSASEMREFLQGFDIMRSHFVSYSVQTLHHGRKATSTNPFYQFNATDCTWDIDLETSLAAIRRIGSSL